MRRAFMIAIVVQGAGTGLGFATVLGISHFLGASAQGAFAIIKNWIELSSAVLLFGLPQGIVYAINRGWLSAAAAARASGIYVLAALLPTLLATGIAASTGYLPFSELVTILALTVGIGGYLYHGLIRGVMLTSNDGMLFSLLSVMPTVVLALVIAAQYVFNRVDLPLAFVINGAVCAATAYLAVRPSLDGTIEYRSGWRSELLRQSGHSFVQALVIAIQPLIVFAVLKDQTGTNAGVGVFSFALIMLVALNALISLVAPILYNSWSKTDGTAVIAALRGRVLALSVAAGGCITMVLLIGAPMIARLGGPTMVDSLAIIRILALAPIPLIFTRFALPAFLAAGRGGHGTSAGIVRLLAAMILLVGLLSAETSPLTASAIAWAGAEWCAALVIGWQALRLRPMTTPIPSLLPDQP